MWFKQGFFCHRLFGNMSDSFEPNLVEGMEELYFGADQVSIPDSDDSTWQRVSYSSTIEEELNRFQERTRLARYCLRLKLNPGITPTNCGRP